MNVFSIGFDEERKLEFFSPFVPIKFKGESDYRFISCDIIVNTKMYNLGKIFLYKNVHFYFVLFIQLYILLNYMKIMSYQLNL